MNNFTEMTKSNLTSLERKGEFFIENIDKRVEASLVYIKAHKKYSELTEYMGFVENLLTDSIKSDLEQLSRIGYFSATETEMELDHSIKHVLIGSYKSSFADLRRALELSIIGVYLSMEKTNKKKAIDWLMSRKNTPGFSASIQELLKNSRFKDINQELNWEKNIKNLYWLLSDYNHTKGRLKGYQELNNFTFFTGGTNSHWINEKSLDNFINLYISVIQEIIVVIALYNPIILVGLPLDEKFGINEPISGYFYDFQAEQVMKIIPDNYKQFFINLISTDEEVISLKESIENMPTLTKEEIQKQVESSNEFFKSLNKK